MPLVTVSQPNVGLKAYFSFKEPLATYVKNKLNTPESRVSLTVTGVSTLVEMIQVDLRDPYLDAYGPAGIDEYSYREDVANNVPLLLFKYVSEAGGITYLRAPLSYINDYSQTQDILYVNKTFAVDLGSLPKKLDTSVIFNDLKDFVETRLGVRPEIAEVSVGEPVVLTQEEHDTRETIRNNAVSVYKTNEIRLEEVTHKYDQLLLRLQTLNISLG